MAEIIYEFLRDVQENDRARAAMGVGIHVIDAMRDEARELYDLRERVAEQDAARAKKAVEELSAPGGASRDWIIARPIARPGDMGRVLLSGYRDGYINRPNAVRRVGEEWWVWSDNTTLRKFSADWRMRGVWGLWANKWDDPNGNSYYVVDFIVDEARGRVFVCCNNYHYVACHDLETAEQIWIYGVPNSAGHVSQDRLWNPVSIALLPNGNIAVCSRHGNGLMDDGAGGTVEGRSNLGHLSEIDGDTGAFIATRAMFNRSGQPWDGEVRRPWTCRMSPHDGRLWVSSWEADAILAFDVASWEVDKYLLKPQGLDVQQVRPSRIAFMADRASEIVVYAGSARKIVGLDVDTGALLWTAGYWEWDDRSGAANHPGAFGSVEDIVDHGDGMMLIADHTNNRVATIPRGDRFTWRYDPEIAEGFEIAVAPRGWDVSSHTLTLSAQDAATARFLDPEAVRLLLKRSDPAAG